MRSRRRRTTASTFWRTVGEALKSEDGARSGFLEEKGEEAARPETYRISLFSVLSHHPDFSYYGVEAAAASLLAVDHFSHGVGDVIPEIVSARRQCPNVRFAVDVHDTKFSAVETGRVLTDLLRPSILEVETETLKDSPVAIVGDFFQESSVRQTASLTSLYSMPLLSRFRFADAERHQYPMHLGLSTTRNSQVELAMDYLVNTLNIRHVGLLYLRDGFGTAYERAFEQRANELNPPLKVASSPLPPKCYRTRAPHH